jgi:hypothetical protein
MHLALALLVCGSLPATDAPPPENFDFGTGTLATWEGEGFYITTAPGKKGPGLACGVSSSDRGPTGRTATLHHAITIPAGAGVLYCTAYAARPKSAEPEDSLDVVVFAAGKRVIPKKVRSASGWQPVGNVLPRDSAGHPRDYVWDVSSYAGQTLRIALIDEDRRKGCHLVCSGFRLLAADDFEPRIFGEYMSRLTREQRLSPAARFESEHFVAMSNADDDFTAMRLHNCELVYELFFDHFRKKGFALHKPASKLMIAVFDTQAGLESYLGQRVPDGMVGFYHLGTNRLVIYDLAQNRTYLQAKRELRDQGRGIPSQMDRTRYVETVDRLAKEWRTDANIAVIMHETSHQLSFNCGMMNRDGDVPLWAAEGLATYCEATENGAWQGIGEANPERLHLLALAKAAHAPLIPLRDLIASDAWLHDAKSFNDVLLGYAQSWALFRMLMEERPQAMRSFLAAIYNRRGIVHRLGDFAEAFGSDFGRLDLRHQQYIDEVLQREYHPPRR